MELMHEQNINAMRNDRPPTFIDYLADENATEMYICLVVCMSSDLW